VSLFIQDPSSEAWEATYRCPICKKEQSPCQEAFVDSGTVGYPELQVVERINSVVGSRLGRVGIVFPNVGGNIYYHDCPGIMTSDHCGPCNRHDHGACEVLFSTTEGGMEVWNPCKCPYYKCKSLKPNSPVSFGPDGLSGEDIDHIEEYYCLCGHKEEAHKDKDCIWCDCHAFLVIRAVTILSDVRVVEVCGQCHHPHINHDYGDTLSCGVRRLHLPNRCGCPGFKLPTFVEDNELQDESTPDYMTWV
jgi:hypothetical protein